MPPRKIRKLSAPLSCKWTTSRWSTTRFRRRTRLWSCKSSAKSSNCLSWQAHEDSHRRWARQAWEWAPLWPMPNRLHLYWRVILLMIPSCQKRRSLSVSDASLNKNSIKLSVKQLKELSREMKPSRSVRSYWRNVTNSLRSRRKKRNGWKSCSKITKRHETGYRPHKGSWKHSLMKFVMKVNLVKKSFWTSCRVWEKRKKNCEINTTMKRISERSCIMRYKTWRDRLECTVVWDLWVSEN